MHFVLLFLGNATISSYDASFACASLQSNCSKSMMFLFVMLFKLLHLLVLSLMLLLLVIFVKPPSGFYVMFMLLLLVAMMFFLLVIFIMFLLLLHLCDVHAPLFSNPMAPSHDALLDHAYL
jgi:hypothetical protein